MFPIRLATLATLAALSVAPARAAPVTWEFIATGITSCAATCHFTGPFTLATFTADDPSSGLSTFDQNPISRHNVNGRDFGPDFIFQVFGLGAASRTAPPDGVPQSPSRGVPQDFDISWTALEGALSAAVDINWTFDNLRIGRGFQAASDADIGPIGGHCPVTQCSGTGDWHLVSTVPVDEPSMLDLLLALGVALGSLKVISVLGMPRTRETTAL